MSNTTWKQAEREVAQRLDGQRVGPTGEATPDVTTDWLAVEVKHRRRLPQWLKDAIRQAVANASHRRLPVAILHEKHQKYDQALVVMRLSDFKEWFGD